MLVLFSLLLCVLSRLQERILPPDVVRCQPLLLALAEKPKTEVHADNGLPPSVISGRVSRSSSGDWIVP
jgi:hypothetical protein